MLQCLGGPPNVLTGGQWGLTGGHFPGFTVKKRLFTLMAKLLVKLFGPLKEELLMQELLRAQNPKLNLI